MTNILNSFNLATMESVARQQAAGRQFRVRGGHQKGGSKQVWSRRWTQPHMHTRLKAATSLCSDLAAQMLAAPPKVKGPVAGDGCLN